jgi:hypothetical protein
MGQSQHKIGGDRRLAHGAPNAVGSKIFAFHFCNFLVLLCGSLHGRYDPQSLYRFPHIMDSHDVGPVEDGE